MGVQTSERAEAAQHFLHTFRFSSSPVARLEQRAPSHETKATIANWQHAIGPLCPVYGFCVRAALEAR